MSSLDSSAAEDDWIGTAPPTDKPTTTFRIAFNNINGLGSQQYGHSIQQLVESQSALGIDLLGIINIASIQSSHESATHYKGVFNNTSSAATSFKLILDKCKQHQRIYQVGQRRYL